MISDKYINNIVTYLLKETREKRSDGSRGNFQEVEGFIFFVDIENSTEAFLEQEDRTYLKFMHTFYAGTYMIFKAYGLREDSIKFLGDGIMGVRIERLNKESSDCPFMEIASKIVTLINTIIDNLGAKDNNIIDGIKISIVPTDPFKLYRAKTGAYGDSKIEYNGLSINQAINMTKIQSDHDFFASMRIYNYSYPGHNYLGNGVYEHEII